MCLQGFRSPALWTERRGENTQVVWSSFFGKVTERSPLSFGILRVQFGGLHYIQYVTQPPPLFPKVLSPETEPSYQ